MNASLTTKQVGYALIVVAIALSFVVYQYTEAIKARNAILHESCSLPDNVCPFKQNPPIESVLGGLIAVFLLGFGLFLIYTYRDVSTVVQEKKEKMEGVEKTLQGDERTVYAAIVQGEGAVYQHDLITKTGMSKVKVTRILDFLEAKGLVERKRRGMSNLVILKNL